MKHVIGLFVFAVSLSAAATELELSFESQPSQPRVCAIGESQCQASFRKFIAFLTETAIQNLTNQCNQLGGTMNQKIIPTSAPVSFKRTPTGWTWESPKISAKGVCTFSP